MIDQTTHQAEGRIGAAHPPTALRGELRRDEPLARHTTWRVGGPAARLYRPADRADLLAFLGSLPADEPLLWLGLGSNLLIADTGWPGTVIETQGCLTDMAVVAPGRLRFEAGVSCAKAARFATRQGLVGIEFLAGIPGTMGGALAMNAGAWGGETWPHVALVRTVDRAGSVRERGPQDFEVGYRHVVIPPGEWFLEAEMTLESGDTEAAQARIKALLERRAATQPTGLPSCGSVFRNPPDGHAARLIEACGLKGLRFGGAEVSPKHANFIINTGNASARDIARLIDHVQAEVERRHGVRLIPEVRRVGDFQL
ncbi:MAG: UDP-N-acetylmuramate dehydrogenase [Thiohalocapsa sp.]|jgi:UDP-N-acetylmuramate dehydrogenase|uniref:UDP-N-acetylmuramate dehydrogenase n=1 Tax=Thiohalocapsa sp. TaxID=2497641 RepID=UPI0025E8417A|nr:UDP-N-acetylmuramate dehydrogenase [Thiohalocapsa sp.]MCG6943035.1 UDP-N-acetylmuramate dehydrogenase [Thiohalocapsa sp.]